MNKYSKRFLISAAVNGRDFTAIILNQRKCQQADNCSLGFDKDSFKAAFYFKHAHGRYQRFLHIFPLPGSKMPGHGVIQELLCVRGHPGWVQQKHRSTKGWRVCTLTPSVPFLNPHRHSHTLSLTHTHTHTHTHTQLLWRWVNGHRDRVFPAGLCRWGLSALFSPEGLGLSFCSGMAEFNWRTLMRSWIAELLMPWLALKMGGRESKKGWCVRGLQRGVCVCVCVCVQSSYRRHPWRCHQIYSWDPRSLFMSRLIYKIIGNNNSSRLILG